MATHRANTAQLCGIQICLQSSIDCACHLVKAFDGIKGDTNKFGRVAPVCNELQLSMFNNWQLTFFVIKMGYSVVKNPSQNLQILLFCYIKYNH